MDRRVADFSVLALRLVLGLRGVSSHRGANKYLAVVGKQVVFFHALVCIFVAENLHGSRIIAAQLLHLVHELFRDFLAEHCSAGRELQLYDGLLLLVTEGVFCEHVEDFPVLVRSDELFHDGILFLKRQRVPQSPEAVFAAELHGGHVSVQACPALGFQIERAGRG